MSGIERLGRTAPPFASTAPADQNLYTYDAAMGTISPRAAASLSTLVANVPATAGISLLTFGCSWGAGLGASNASFAYPWRLNRSLGTGSLSNQCVTGSCTIDAAQKIATAGVSSGLAGIITLDSLVNDQSHGVGAQPTAGFLNGLRAFIDFALAGSPTSNRIPYSSSQVAFTGTWATTAWTGASTGNMKTTSTLNDSFTVSFKGDAATLMLVGRDDAHNGTAGAAFSVSYGGASIATGTCSNQMDMSNGGNTLGHVPVRLSGFGAGYHTVTITKTDANGSVLAFDCGVQKPSTGKPTVVILKSGYLPVYGGTGSDAAVDYYNNLVDTALADSFIAGDPVLATVSVNSTGWNRNTSLYTDGLHPSDEGHNIIAAALLTTLSGATYRYGQNSPSWQDVQVAAPSAVTGSDNFTRANNPSTPGVTSTGAVPWQADTPVSVFGIASNHLTPQNSLGWSACSIETGRANGTFQWTINDATSLGLAFRLSSYTSMLMIYSGSLWTGGNGAWTNIGSGVTYTTGDVIKVVTSGTTIQMFKNGTLINTVTSSFNQAATRIGIVANSTTTQALSAISYAP